MVEGREAEDLDGGHFGEGNGDGIVIGTWRRQMGFGEKHGNEGSIHVIPCDGREMQQRVRLESLGGMRMNGVC